MLRPDVLRAVAVGHISKHQNISEHKNEKKIDGSNSPISQLHIHSNENNERNWRNNKIVKFSFIIGASIHCGSAY